MSGVARGHGEARLSARQRALLDRWLPRRTVVADHSWGLVGTFVLEVESGPDRLIVKAADDRDHHLAREIHAHRHWLEPWTTIGRAPVLLRADERARLLVTRFLPGRLVQGDRAERQPATFRQAGALLARFHGQLTVLDGGWAPARRQDALEALERPHRLDAATVRRLRADIASWPTAPADLVPTHGDWQPRNWLIDDGGRVGVIDFGRAALRTRSTDLVRLADRSFQGRPDLEEAFLDGYGADPRRPEDWRADRLAAAIGTAVWALAVGDDAFEEEGRRRIGELLDGR